MSIIKNYYFLIFPSLVILFMYSLDKILNLNELWIKLLIAIPIAYLLSPRIKIIKKRYGKEKRLSWLFSKKIIYIKLKE
ncbi:hypothetical protein [Polaribacter porphyrae]|uniref:Uncharacterized protein n=1 Tax=Polaribacter porphyrae TaxID=1137780 RepID=A0A2S7WS02_9FLAO|nr:hypothetical protein [Polaribacter porphyrae]PQJ80378.1 hypothetical protein BTO18_14865 [Polaribacter porphyrae]